RAPRSTPTDSSRLGIRTRTAAVRTNSLQRPFSIRRRNPYRKALSESADRAFSSNRVSLHGPDESAAVANDVPDIAEDVEAEFEAGHQDLAAQVKSFQGMALPARVRGS